MVSPLSQKVSPMMALCGLGFHYPSVTPRRVTELVGCQVSRGLAAGTKTVSPTR